MGIKFEKISFDYNAGTPLVKRALHDIDLEIKSGIITAIVGETGSGKSTLVQHLNGLTLPTKGSVFVDDFEIEAGKKPKGLKSLRSKVGLVFQFPEMQLFEETVLKDVMFGPKNFGFTDEEVLAQAKRSLQMVGIAPDLWENSPLDLSGGQKRRVAIAGVLASQPQILVLDEPTAGLDPQGAQEMMNLFLSLNQEHGITLIMVTHDMEHVLSYADEVVALKDGQVVFTGDTQSFFNEGFKVMGFVAPHVIKLKDYMILAGFDVEDSTDFKDLIEIMRKRVVK